MKTPSLALLNSIGFTNPAQKVLYAAAVLKAALVSSPAVTISAAVPVVAAKAEVIAQTAKSARSASLAVSGVANTTGYGFGELYLNSPAYPIGTPIPAIPAKPASVAVVGVPAVVGVAAVPAVVSSSVTAIKGWEEAVTISRDRSGGIGIFVYLPYTSSAGLIGATPIILEMTPPTLQPLSWLDTKASETLETLTTEPPTLEQYFYKYAKLLLGMDPTNTSIFKNMRLINGVTTPVKEVKLILPSTNYDFNSDSLQLDKLATL
jgi:hypothetical protein